MKPLRNFSEGLAFMLSAVNSLVSISLSSTSDASTRSFDSTTAPAVRCTALPDTFSTNLPSGIILPRYSEVLLTFLLSLSQTVDCL